LNASLVWPHSKGKGAVLQAQASVKLAQRQFAQAAKLAGDSLDMTPESVVALNVLGASYVAQKQAIRDRSNKGTVEQDPNWAEGFEILGRVAQRTDASGALDAFNKALTINPNLTQASLAWRHLFSE